MSLVESVTKTGISFFGGVGLQMAIFPLFGYEPNLGAAFGMTTIFAVYSILVNYGIRRWFETKR